MRPCRGVPGRRAVHGAAQLPKLLRRTGVGGGSTTAAEGGGQHQRRFFWRLGQRVAASKTDADGAKLSTVPSAGESIRRSVAGGQRRAKPHGEWLRQVLHAWSHSSRKWSMTTLFFSHWWCWCLVQQLQIHGTSHRGAPREHSAVSFLLPADWPLDEVASIEEIGFTREESSSSKRNW